MKYKHMTSGRVIDRHEYENLMSFQKEQYSLMSESGTGDFLTSTVIGAVTDSALLGGLLGGSLMGGLLGDSLDGDLFN